MPLQERPARSSTLSAALVAAIASPAFAAALGQVVGPLMASYAAPRKLSRGNSSTTSVPSVHEEQEELTSHSPQAVADMAACKLAVKDIMETTTVRVAYIFIAGM